MSKNGATSSKPAVLLKVKDITAKVKSKKLKTASVAKAKKSTVAKKKRDTKKSIVVQTETPFVEKIDLPAFEIPSGVIMRNQLQLALLSPFRFPIDNDKLASQVARFAGVLFVMLGAFFTLFHMQDFGGDYARTNSSSQVAQTAGANYDCSDPAGPNYDAVYCATNVNPVGNTATVNVNPTPPVDLVVEGASPYTNVVPINIFVPYAHTVDVHAYQKNTGTSITLGRAVNVSNNSWRFYWDTRQYPDGEYRIKVLIQNEYGSYNFAGASYIKVENYPVNSATTGGATTAGTATQTQTQTGGTTTAGTNPPPPTATTTGGTTTPPTGTVSVGLSMIGTAPLSGFATAKIIVAGATAVKLSARGSGSSSFTLLGYATLYGGNEWRYEWNTVTVPNGIYTLKAQAIFTGASYGSNEIGTSILNGGGTATTTVIATASTTPTTSVLEPEITLTIPKTSPLVGDADILIKTVGAEFVELYAKPGNATTPYFLGRAQKVNIDTWKFKWVTKQNPNGEYKVFARVKHSYGTTESTRMSVSILNVVPPAYTETEKAAIEKMQNLDTELKASVVPHNTPPPNASSTTPTPQIPPVYMTSPTAVMENIKVDNTDEKEQLETELRLFRLKIQKDLHDFAVAVRAGDENKMQSIREHIENTRKEILETLKVTGDTGEIKTKIDEHLKVITQELENLTIRNESIIKERMAETAFKDSDRDGIGDYDEVNLYQTDPFSADTDKDGFIDGTEVVAGYDPNNSAPQVLVAYESPKELGVVREDILEVETIVGLKATEGVVDESAQGAIIAGKGLPNSFVTLYIFSTPIVVTIKTDTDGSWSYIFDKELDDGEHEVYVGLTDNAGRIVAKSNPLSFVKTAEAFTPVDASDNAPVTAVSSEPSLLNQNIMLVVVSITVVALGLVLILLGLYVNTRRTPELKLS